LTNGQRSLHWCTCSINRSLYWCDRRWAARLARIQRVWLAPLRSSFLSRTHRGGAPPFPTTTSISIYSPLNFFKYTWTRIHPRIRERTRKKGRGGWSVWHRRDTSRCRISEPSTPIFKVKMPCSL